MNPDYLRELERGYIALIEVYAQRLAAMTVDQRTRLLECELPFWLSRWVINDLLNAIDRIQEDQVRFAGRVALYQRFAA